MGISTNNTLRGTICILFLALFAGFDARPNGLIAKRLAKEKMRQEAQIFASTIATALLLDSKIEEFAFRYKKSAASNNSGAFGLSYNYRETSHSL